MSIFIASILQIHVHLQQAWWELLFGGFSRTVMFVASSFPSGLATWLHDAVHFLSQAISCVLVRHMCLYFLRIWLWMITFEDIYDSCCALIIECM